MTAVLESSPSARLGLAPNAQRSSAHASRVQRALSSAHRINVRGLAAACELESAHAVGGDFVDLLEVEGRLLAVLGDVSGKGAAASLIAAVLLSSVQHHASALGAQPGALLAAVDRSVRSMLDRTGAIVTLVLASIDPVGGTARVASAGHHPVILATDGVARQVGPTCPPLGAADACSSEIALAFAPGSTLVLASDGITEQTDAAGAEFGLGRLGSLARAMQAVDPRTAVDGVLRAVDHYAGLMPAADDRAIVVITAGVAA